MFPISVPDTLGSLSSFTVTEHVAVLLPSAVFTVMVAVPGATALTLPLESTVAMLLLLELHDTSLLVALLGLTVAVSVKEPPTVMLAEVLSNETPVTATGEALTVTIQ